MFQMFNGCSKLTSLILTNFDTSLVTTMTSMFSSCSSLVELDLSSFKIPLVGIMSNMFKECEKLEYINLNNSFEKKSGLKIIDMFDSIPINVVICINKNNSKITSLISNITCAIIDCSNDWKKNQKKILFGK